MGICFNFFYFYFFKRSKLSLLIPTVNKEHYNLSLFNLFKCFLNSDAFYMVFCFTYSCRINKSETNSIDNQFIFNCITCCSCNVHPQWRVLRSIKHSIKSISHIRFAHNSYWNTVFNYVSNSKRINQTF